MSNLPDELRGVIVQTGAGQLLLPNSVITEVLSFSDPDAVDGAPSWLLGLIRWRGWQVPLLDFADLAGVQARTTQLQGGRRRVIVVKALGGNPRLPYMALLADGFPRLVTVKASNLQAPADATDIAACIHAIATLNDEEAIIPDLDKVEAKLTALAA
ncbi:chemotaxis protein CheW [Lysobacter soyae]|uniref:Chemotaxis protein CheW n=1 Tax=Lysobacter soyae TaxID=2764185 RepID=A0ABX8WRM6_9GAMM|nr:chemotaxis protein CheW [Lysobacter sp. CJ11]QYR53477.1 chemotaxis protein CheW [Lysobacter sp. CJ11]